MKLDLITVVFDHELHLLKWQAASISKYVDKDLIQDIIIVDNGSQSCTVDRSWYGEIQHKVRVLTHKDIDLVVMQHLDGWRTQQLCKLLAAAKSNCEWSVVLDAKTMFSNEFPRVGLFDAGKVHVGRQPINAYWSDSQKYVEKYYNIEMDKMIGPGGVPFFFHTKTLNQMINTIYDFNTWFQNGLYEKTPPHRTLLTEFMLYSAFCQHKGITDKLYGQQSQFMPYNIAENEIEKFEGIFDTQADSISIAEKANSQMESKQKERWEKHLNDRFLC